jgi:serine/threonine-protein kinase
MELLEGESLHDHVKRVGPLGAADVVTFMMQVAQGLDKAHGYVTKQGKAAPIVHRDLKPENLFLTVREDGLKVVKILDFGIAKVLSEDVAMSRGLKGTPLYMAHEQLHGEALSPKTDIWAFGLITFFLLTGRSYWLSASAEQASLATVIAEVLTSSIAPPSDHARKIGVEPAWTAAFDEWFTRCVNRDSQARFASAGDAASALAAALLGQGWSATLPPGLFPPESISGPVSDGVQLARSESVSAAVVSTARLTRPAVVPRSLVAGGAVLVAAGFAYAILHREPVSAPKAPVAGADAHAGPEAVNALPSARSADPVPSAEPAAALPAPSSSAVIATDGTPPQGKKRPGATRVKASEGTAQTGSAAATPSPGNSSERIYNER